MRHDFCYEHGQATYGKDRRACDSDFLADAQRLCKLVNRGGWEWSCPMRASVAYVAVSLFGGMYSAVKGQSQCNYEQSLGPARDAVLSGRFRDPVRDEPLGIFATGQGMLRFVPLDRPDDVFSLDPATLIFAPLGKSLGQMGLTGTDFLAYPPTAANVDARDGLDEIVLFALHRHDRQDLDRGGAGLVVLVVNPGQRRASVFSGSPSMLTDFADPAARKANDALLPRVAESLFAPVLALPVEDGGERLLLFAPGTAGEAQGRKAKMLTFSHAGDLTMWHALNNDVVDPWTAGYEMGYGDWCEKHVEKFRRFQYPSLRMGGQVVALFRDRCEDEKNSSFAAQSTLVTLRYNQTRDGLTYDRVERIAHWPKAAHPIMVMDRQGDAAKGMWSIYLTDKTGVGKDEMPKEVMRLRLRDGDGRDRAFDIWHKDVDTALDGYFNVPGHTIFDGRGQAVLVLRRAQPGLWRMLTITVPTGGQPVVRESVCPAPFPQLAAIDDSAVMTLALAGPGPATMAAVLRHGDAGALPTLARLEMDADGTWKSDGQGCSALPQWHWNEVPFSPASAKH